MGNVVNINGKAVERIEYRNLPVVTLPMIDEMHERPKGTARVAFNRNKKRFLKGEDFFLVPQEEWKPLISVCERYADSPKPASKYGGDMFFLTETGYLMLVKVFDDDLSWRIQRELVKRYFAQATEIPALNIKYTLDLAKLCTNPTKAGLRLLNRLTGVNVTDILHEMEEQGRRHPPLPGLDS